MYDYGRLFADTYKFLKEKESKYDEVLQGILSQCEKGYTHLQGTNYVVYEGKLLCVVKKDLSFSEDCFMETMLENDKFVNKVYFVKEKEEYEKVCKHETFSSRCSFKVYKTDFYIKDVVFK